MQKLVYWSYPTWLMFWSHKGWHNCPATGKLRISSQIHPQAVWNVQIAFDKPQMLSLEISLFSRALPRWFVRFTTACDTGPFWGATLYQWHLFSIPHSNLEAGRGDRKTEFGNREQIDLVSWSQVLQSLASIGRGRWEKGSLFVWEALYLPSWTTAALICSSLMHLTHHQPWLLHDFFPHLSLY